MTKKRNNSSSKIQSDIENIYKTVYTGNGKPSLIAQITQIDTKISSLEKEMEIKFKHITDVVTEKFNNISNQITKEFEQKALNDTGMWNFKTALVTSLLAAVTSIFVIVLKEFILKV
jgi:predicted PurR-regulated permease PerM